MTLATEARWRGKILAKIVLSRLPVPYRAWRRIGIFRHGHMRSGDYAIEVFEQAAERAGLGDVRGLRLLELGPGDSLFSALLTRAAGAASSVHVDVGEHADRDLAHYREFARLLEERGYDPIHLCGLGTLEEVLEHCDARYLTRGLDSLRALPSGSIDFTWSQSTIEHIRAGDLMETARELRRVMSDDATAVHLIDLRDHLADGLNHLRVARRLWESDFMAKSGFYTNRMRFSALCELFERAGFRCEVAHVTHWGVLPTPRRAMVEEFRVLPERELLTRTFVLRLRPA
ncbi:MAG: methyltransferase domain-containing protein [Acidimicrobiia bacterium]